MSNTANITRKDNRKTFRLTFAHDGNAVSRLYPMTETGETLAGYDVASFNGDVAKEETRAAQEARDAEFQALITEAGEGENDADDLFALMDAG